MLLAWLVLGSVCSMALFVGFAVLTLNRWPGWSDRRFPHYLMLIPALVFAGIPSTSWAVATSFVIPCIVFEELGVSASIRGSAHVFKQRWGLNVRARVLTAGFGIGIGIAIGVIGGVTMAYSRAAGALLPGWSDTDMLAFGRENNKFRDATISRTPVRRWAGPDEYGSVAAYLARRDLTFHTGDELVVDGGYTKF